MSDSSAPQPPRTDRLTAPQLRNRWRWCRRVVLIVMGCLLLCIGWAVAEREWNRVEGNRELTAAIAEADRTDADWTWNRLNATRKRPAAGMNSAEFIPQIKKLSPPGWAEEWAKEKWQPQLLVLPNIQFSPPLLAAIRRDVTAATKAIQLARTLKDYPFGYREIILPPEVLDYSVDDTQYTRFAVDLLRWDIVMALEDGDKHRAMMDLLAIVGASRSIGDEPTVISQLIRLSARAIAVQSAEWILAQTTDAPSLDELQAALTQDSHEPLLLYALRGERAIFHQLFENLQQDKTTLEAVTHTQYPNAWVRFWWEFTYRGNLPGDHARAINFLTQYVETARLPLPDQAPWLAKAKLPARDPKYLISSLMIPTLKVAPSFVGRETTARCAGIGIACERFRQKNGRWPESLGELSPAFIPAIPLDPFSGRPFQFAKLNDGLVVYSVGTSPQSEIGKPPVSLELPQGVEFGFRLWNPDQRRLPSRVNPAKPRAERQP